MKSPCLFSFLCCSSRSTWYHSIQICVGIWKIAHSTVNSRQVYDFSTCAGMVMLKSICCCIYFTIQRTYDTIRNELVVGEKFTFSFHSWDLCIPNRVYLLSHLILICCTLFRCVSNSFQLFSSVIFTFILINLYHFLLLECKQELVRVVKYTHVHMTKCLINYKGPLRYTIFGLFDRRIK